MSSHHAPCSRSSCGWNMCLQTCWSLDSSTDISWWLMDRCFSSQITKLVCVCVCVCVCDVILFMMHSAEHQLWRSLWQQQERKEEWRVEVQVSVSEEEESGRLILHTPRSVQLTCWCHFIGCCHDNSVPLHPLLQCFLRPPWSYMIHDGVCVCTNTDNISINISNRQSGWWEMMF